MKRVPRTVRVIAQRGAPPGENGARTLEAFRDLGAWVLLGDPGAGKSESLKQEAEETGGVLLRVSEFIHLEPPEEWRNATLFLDGLDEVRGNGESVLERVCARLRRLGAPRFRISCRAADWYGASDREDLGTLTPDGRVEVLQLQPLSAEGIRDSLRENLGVEEPESFIATAESRGLSKLLENPQTLALLATAVREAWPATREETYRLACERLALEGNDRYRRARGKNLQVSGSLEAAGQLFASMLLSGKSGIALDPADADELFPDVGHFMPPDPVAAKAVLETRLFSSSGDEGRFIPVHRSVAEFLAAGWIGGQVDVHGLPLGRLLGLLLGRDGRAVSGLRGLYAWLAVSCLAAREPLIAADPLTVLLYGDVKPLPDAQKMRLLGGLQAEIQQNAIVCRELLDSQALVALNEPSLMEEIFRLLRSDSRDATSQLLAACALEMVSEGPATPELRTILKGMIVAADNRQSIRAKALKVWLDLFKDLGEAVSLLNAVTEGSVPDPDDELAGVLLMSLYPGTLAASELIPYLHAPRQRNFFGRYRRFLNKVFPESVPGADLPSVLDRLALRQELDFSDLLQSDLKELTESLLVQAVQVSGLQFEDEQLLSWLKIGERQGLPITRLVPSGVADWLGQHPERYKSLLGACLSRCAASGSPGVHAWRCMIALRNTPVPEDLGQWHLQQAKPGLDPDLIEFHLRRAVGTLTHGHGCQGLSLERLEKWADEHPYQRHLLEKFLKCDLEAWRVEDAVRSKWSRDERQRRTVEIHKRLPEIRNGTAAPGLLHHLAAIWVDLHPDARGASLAERFDAYVENGQELLAASEEGFLACPLREELPSVEEIIELHAQAREHLIRKPCLIGMEVRWDRLGAAAIDSLADETLRRMVAFRLTYAVGKPPRWFEHLVSVRPALVSKALIPFAAAAFRSDREHIDTIERLERDPRYRAVAMQAAGPLLTRFPVRAHSAKLPYLGALLRVALRLELEGLTDTIELKLSRKGMDAAQRVYWLSAGLLLAPERYEATLWEYVGSSAARAGHVLDFVLVGRNSLERALPLATTGRLIELLLPHAELEWRSGYVSQASLRGDQLRAMVTRLGTVGSDEAEAELCRLLALPAVHKLRVYLEEALRQLRIRRREAEFEFLPLKRVAQVIANHAPANVADLAALLLDHLDEIAAGIRRENDDGFRAFWNIENKQPTGKREENYCRDEIYRRLRDRLQPFGVDCRPEADYAGDKRADIVAAYRNEFELPIEVKRDDNRDLWTALREQLMARYSVARKTGGRGIYLVLWFGCDDLPRARDGGKRPRSPQELQARLEALLDAEERGRIFVRVVDVSWPR